MTVSFTERVRLAESVLLQQIQGEIVFLNMNSESYFGLDSTGSRMFEVLNSSDSIETAYTTLLNEYDVEPQQLRSDLTAFVANLLENGLMIIESH